MYLIQQEYDMYKRMNKIIEQEDLDFICDRRGFNVNEKNYLTRNLKELDIGENLEFDRTHESIKMDLTDNDMNNIIKK